MIVQNQPLGTSMKEGLHTFWHLLRKTNKQKLVGNLLLLIAPILLTLGESLAISKMNQNYYGIFTTNDRTKTSFAKLTENLIQIDNSKYDSKDTAENSGIWVSKKTFAEAQKVSPTFAKYRKGIDWMLNESIWPDSWPVKMVSCRGICLSGAYERCFSMKDYIKMVVTMKRSLKRSIKSFQKVLSLGR